MKVYEFKGFPNPARVRMALAEKGLMDETIFVHVDLPGGEHQTETFLAKNPSGAVPVLELADGTMISESVAITEYLDHLDGSPVLTGTTAQERGVISMVQRKVEVGFLDAIAAYFHHATEGLGPDIEPYQVAEWGEKQREKAMVTLHWMEATLKEREFLVGDRFTVADITAYAGFLFAGFVKLEIPDDCPKVKAYFDNLASRESAALAV